MGAFVGDGRLSQAGVCDRRRAGNEVRLDEREARADGNEHGCAGYPPRLAEATGEEHHDEQGDADRDERAAELEPVAECPFQVAHLAQVMAARPPEVEHSEGELHEPDDPQPEHPEQHAGADRPGGRLAHVAGPTAGVDPEGGEQGDLLEQPGDEEEALDAGGFLDEFCGHSPCRGGRLV